MATKKELDLKREMIEQQKADQEKFDNDVKFYERMHGLKKHEAIEAVEFYDSLPKLKKPKRLKGLSR